MSTVSLDCPRCLQPLAHLRLGGVDTDVCEHCGGLWLDAWELVELRR